MRVGALMSRPLPIHAVSDAAAWTIRQWGSASPRAERHCPLAPPPTMPGCPAIMAVPWQAHSAGQQRPRKHKLPGARDFAREQEDPKSVGPEDRIL